MESKKILNKKGRVRAVVVIFSLVLLLIIMMSFVSAQLCNTGDMKSTLRKALYDYLPNPGASSLNASEIKSFLDFYLSSGSQNVTSIKCDIKATLSNYSYEEINNKFFNFTKNVNIPTCEDGTQYGQCSATKPKYCFAGKLVNRCRLCGCSSSQEICNISERAEFTVNEGMWGKCVSKLLVGKTVEINDIDGDGIKEKLISTGVDVGGRGRSINISISGNIIVSTIPEWIAQKDLNNDGDMKDSLIRYYNINTGELKIIELITELQINPVEMSISNNIIAFSSGYSSAKLKYYNIDSEKVVDTGVNGNGASISNNIIAFSSSNKLKYYDINTGIVRDTGLAAVGYPSALSISNNIITFISWGYELKYYDIHTDKAVSTGINLTYNSAFVHISNNIIAFTKYEGEGVIKEDFNRDGDTSDFILHYYDINTGQLTNTGVETNNLDVLWSSSPISNSNNIITFSRGSLVMYYDIGTGKLTSTGINGYGAAIFGRIIAFASNESATGDLNDDGDTNDFVLRYITLSKPQTVVEFKPIEGLLCSDGTFNNTCSLTIPLFCMSGNLTLNCQKCGCILGGFSVCNSNGTCSLNNSKISGFKAEYYNNQNLTGNPVLIRDDPEINFNWKEGSPAPEVNANSFSVRWTKSQEFVTGAYRFKAETDDGVRLWIDNQLIIDKWDYHNVQTDIAEINLTSGTHIIKMEYLEEGGIAVAKLSWGEISKICTDGTFANKCSPVKPLYCSDKVLINNCMVCGCSQYYHTCNATGQCLINTSYTTFRGEYYLNKLIGAREPIIVIDYPEINFDWGTGGPHLDYDVGYEFFSARYTRPIEFKAGRYKFTTITDDGVRLWIDDQKIIDRWVDGKTTQIAEINLTAGPHVVRMEYYENTGLAMAKLSWESLEIYNITCSKNQDCGINGYNGTYFCQNESVYKKYVNYTCINPGATAAYCISLNTSIRIDACGANEYCANNVSACQSNLSNLCSDGTLNYTCSLTKPLFCANGNLTSSCQKCGCAGNQTCFSNGTCAERTCYDSDGGLNYNLKGTVNTGSLNYGLPWINTGNLNYTDYCLVTDKLIEYGCSSNNSLYWVVNSNCSNGCSDGVCLSGIISNFSDGSAEKNITFNETITNETIYIEVPADSNVTNATIEVTSNTTNVTLDVGTDGTVDATINSTNTTIIDISPSVNEVIANGLNETAPTESSSAEENPTNEIPAEEPVPAGEIPATNEILTGEVIYTESGSILIPLTFYSNSPGIIRVSNPFIKYTENGQTEEISLFEKIWNWMKSLF